MMTYTLRDGTRLLNPSAEKKEFTQNPSDRK